MYAGVAVMGYTMFGESTQSQFTLNLPQDLVATKIAVWTTVSRCNIFSFHYLLHLGYDHMELKLFCFNRFAGGQSIYQISFCKKILRNSFLLLLTSIRLSEIHHHVCVP